jgi:hypothetical protein
MTDLTAYRGTEANPGEVPEAEIFRPHQLDRRTGENRDEASNP